MNKFDFTAVPMSPVAIKEIGNIIVNSAIEQVAKQIGIPAENVVGLMETDEAVNKRVQAYIISGYNFALAKVRKN